MTSFFITGMPRARTAWVSNYLTHGSCFCEHEGLSYVDTPEALVQRMANRREYESSGISDSGAVLFHKELRRRCPGARWVFLLREKSECEDSFFLERGIKLSLDEHVARVHAAIKPGDLVVHFKDIDARILEVAQFVCPTWHHVQDRHDMLLQWDVQLTGAALGAGIRRTLRSGVLNRVDNE